MYILNLMKNILNARNQFGALLNQRMSPLGLFLMNGARHRENRFTLVNGMIYCDKRTAVFIGFNQQNALGRPANQAVALRKMHGEGFRKKRIFAENRSSRSYFGREFFIFRRI